IRLGLATLQQGGGDKSNAARGYEAILDQAPDNVVALNNLAWVYQEFEDKRAIEYAKRAYQLAGSSPVVADTYGWFLVLDGNLQQGLNVLKRAAEGAPLSMEIRYHLAYALLRVGDEDEAMQLLDEVLASDQEFEAKKDARALRATLE
ncbi:MAG: tetratricopeptide repeat protein, partial [Chromatiales bacterium]|nr:tetratricopeptide repeat protein [Chromatiales bacterium]